MKTPNRLGESPGWSASSLEAFVLVVVLSQSSRNGLNINNDFQGLFDREYADAPLQQHVVAINGH